MTCHRSALLLDASCLLNLYATGFLEEITVSLPIEFRVAAFVVEFEALFIRRADPTGGKDVKVPVNLTSLLEEGLIQLMRLEGSAEEASFVELAADLDDGEAVTGALAFYRGCSVATDDRKARRVLGQLIPPVELVSTLELLKLWAEDNQVPEDKLASAMAAMQSCASYRPGRRDPLYEWWRSTICRSES